MARASSKCPTTTKAERVVISSWYRPARWGRLAGPKSRRHVSLTGKSNVETELLLTPHEIPALNPPSSISIPGSILHSEAGRSRSLKGFLLRGIIELPQVSIPCPDFHVGLLFALKRGSRCHPRPLYRLDSDRIPPTPRCLLFAPGTSLSGRVSVNSRVASSDSPLFNPGLSGFPRGFIPFLLRAFFIRHSSSP